MHKKQTCKPGSVDGDHLSGWIVTNPL